MGFKLSSAVTGYQEAVQSNEAAAGAGVGTVDGAGSLGEYFGAPSMRNGASKGEIGAPGKMEDDEEDGLSGDAAGAQDLALEARLGTMKGCSGHGGVLNWNKAFSGDAAVDPPSARRPLPAGVQNEELQDSETFQGY